MSSLSERLRALCRLFIDSGDMTPYAALKFGQLLDELEEVGP